MEGAVDEQTPDLEPGDPLLLGEFMTTAYRRWVLWCQLCS